jgi:hypothetical protein
MGDGTFDCFPLGFDGGGLVSITDHGLLRQLADLEITPLRGCLLLF